VSLLVELDAFFTDHRLCGDLDDGGGGPVVWMSCDCGACTARRADQDEDQPPPDRSLAGTRILVVENDDVNREIIATTLTLEGANVMAVSTALEALPLLSGADIILTDFVMPG
jgi:PleD family two-component response regulator